MHFFSFHAGFGGRFAGVQPEQRVQQDRHLRLAVGGEAVSLSRSDALLDLDAPARRTHNRRPHEAAQDVRTGEEIKALQVLPRRHVDLRVLCGQHDAANHALSLPEEQRGLPHQEARVSGG